jgi:prevent-host-death family protein
MKSLLVSEDVVPIGEFKAQAPHWLRRAAATGRPIVITQNGRPAGVLLAPVEFDRLNERDQFLESVARGLDDAAAGRVMNTDELRARLAARRQEREER